MGLGFALASLASPALAALEIFACEPEWAVLARELGGEYVSTYSATTPLQDPHQIQARPSLIARARKADLMICTGAELEAGWLPQVLRQAANPRVQPGVSGFLEASSFVERLEIPQSLDRSEGDVHPAGNPHIQLDPRNIEKVADALARRLAELDTANTAAYRQRHEQFSARWKHAMERWAARAAPLRGLPVVTHHKDFIYLLNWLGLREAGLLEPKPGLPPTVSHLENLVAGLKANKAAGILRAPFQDERAAAWLADRTGLKVLSLPATTDTDLFAFFDRTLAELARLNP